MIPRVPGHVPDDLADGAWCSSGPDEAPAGMPDLWPEDVLTEAEWEAGWFDRQVTLGRLRSEDSADYLRCFGGSGDGA